MNVISTKLDGVLVIQPDVLSDHRGFFMESYNQEKFRQCGLDYQFVQDNQSLSREEGVIRGLHYQLPPKAQTKLIRVVTGAIYDVVVDLRKNSATFGQWLGIELNAENHYQLLIPKGFAHGFCTIASNTQIAYKVDDFYSPELDRGIRWNDPALGIDWPVTKPILSDKDLRLPLLEDAKISFYEGDLVT